MCVKGVGSNRNVVFISVTSIRSKVRAPIRKMRKSTDTGRCCILWRRHRKKNEKMLAEEGKQAWNQREYRMLLLIKEYLERS